MLTGPQERVPKGRKLIRPTGENFSFSAGYWWYDFRNGRRARCAYFECEVCHQFFVRLPNAVKASKRQLCSKQCSGKFRAGKNFQGVGPAHHSWKGGRKLTSKGYVMLYAPDHPRRDVVGYVWEHHLVVEKELGRYLFDDERVHHKNGNRSDNSRGNLELWSTCHPYGQRATDLTEYAKKILTRYAPHLLKRSAA